ncbi:WXG100 family type VII secretion target [Streptomyces sp. NPDC048278]|uniref:WXG100 family type VII secretion target n=1 Tax=Streptomyces sp. NPDC048278 TaxID=3155809 RepID=UPI003420BD1D
MLDQQVDVVGMRAAQPHFETALTETSRVYSSMHDQAMALESSWKGDAAEQFIQALNDWLENCNTVRQQLQIVTDKLAQHTGVYQQVHSDTTDQSRSLTQVVSAGLPGF